MPDEPDFDLVTKHLLKALHQLKEARRAFGDDPLSGAAEDYACYVRELIDEVEELRTGTSLQTSGAL